MLKTVLLSMLFLVPHLCQAGSVGNLFCLLSHLKCSHPCVIDSHLLTLGKSSGSQSCSFAECSHQWSTAPHWGGKSCFWDIYWKCMRHSLSWCMPWLGFGRYFCSQHYELEHPPCHFYDSAPCLVSMNLCTYPYRKIKETIPLFFTNLS